MIKGKEQDFFSQEEVDEMLKSVTEKYWSKAMKQQGKMKYKSYHGTELIQELRGKPACILTNTGNGFKIKFPSYRCIEQDIFMSLDYSQAAYLKECLNQWDDK